MLFRTLRSFSGLKSYFKFGAIAVGVTLATLGLQKTGALQILEWAALDQKFRLRPLEARQVPIVMVTITEADLSSLKQFPISDQTLSIALETLKRERPFVIGLDLYRDIPVEPGHRELLETFASTPNLIGIEKAVGDTNGGAVQPPPILRDRNQVAINDLVIDADGKIRRNLLSIQQQGKTRLTLGTQLALSYLKAAGIQPKRTATGQIQLGKATYQSLSQNIGGYVRADIGGYQILSNYLRVPGGFATISIKDVLAGRIPAGLMRDRIVLIGSTAESLRGDRFYVPFSTQPTEAWFGVEIHANLAAQLISSAIEDRTPLSSLPEALEWAWILGWASLGTFLGWSVQSRRGLVLVLVAIVTLFVSSHLLFLVGWWAIVIAPLIAFLSAGFVSRIYWIWQTLKQVNQALEQKVLERTQELEHKNTALEQAKLAADSANQAKSVFLASMNHELRTPLTAILGFSELLKDSERLNEEEQENIEIINRSGTHLLDLINDVLELSKIEAGAATINAEVTHLPTLLTTVESVVRGTAIVKQLTFKTDYAADLPPVIKLDQRKLRQVLINLLSNAVKFTIEGYVALTVTVQQNELYFAIEDTGTGIAPDELHHLFQPFFQAQAGRDSYKGTGLGLSISQRFVQLMGGDLMVKSSLDQGSTFTVKVPYEVVEDAIVEDRTPETRWRLDPSSPFLSVLVVDDDPAICRFLVQLLSKVGFDVRSTTTGTDAIAQWQSWQPQLMLIDLQMPEIDGSAIAQHVRSVEQSREIEQQTEYRQRDTILIALTASTQSHQAFIFASGFDDVAWKPFREVTLLTKIAQHLDVRYVNHF